MGAEVVAAVVHHGVGVAIAASREGGTGALIGLSFGDKPRLSVGFFSLRTDGESRRKEVFIARLHTYYI